MFGITTAYSMGLPALDAREDFVGARRSRLTVQVSHCITGRLSRERRARWLLVPAALAGGTARPNDEFGTAARCHRVTTDPTRREPRS